jgi:uncharacterized protein YcbK (DUF882 family)
MAALQRRKFLGAGTLAFLGATLLKPAHAATLASTEAKTLSVHNMHTGEKIKATFWENGNYVPQALREINKILRDHRSGEVHAIDPKLLHTLYDTKVLLEKTNSPVQIISGYRSPASNAMLAAHSGGVAKKSLHMQGMATDIRIEGVCTSHIRNAGLALKRGGVGFYPVSQFVHLDTGAVRAWAGA